MKINEIKEFGASVLHIETEHMSIGTVLPEGKETEEIVSIALAKAYHEMISATINNPIDRILYGLAHIHGEIDTLNVTIYKPSVKSMKAFVAAIYLAFKSGEMDEIHEYEKNICTLPKEVEDYIKELISKQYDCRLYFILYSNSCRSLLRQSKLNNMSFLEFIWIGLCCIGAFCLFAGK